MARILRIARNVSKCSANYYGLNVSELEHHIRRKITYAGGLFESGMLVLRGAALESAREMGHTAGIKQGFVLLPPRAVLNLCLYLRPVPAVAATVNAFWDYVVAEKLHESTSADCTILPANTLKLSAIELKNKGCLNVWRSPKSGIVSLHSAFRPSNLFRGVGEIVYL